MNCTGNCNHGRWCTTCRTNDDRNTLPDLIAVIGVSAALWVLVWVAYGYWSAQ